ncbi:multiprotein-bridging factor 1 family protein [Kitasatospora sp. NPDC059795]|uniref:helix-turn-helix domain-containing protein n=1 Tax=Kitasatospora sp. NPDC059795 TaxID=3346949 RepID=UPI00364E3779
MSDELFDSVDALLAAVSTGLPVPAERKRLRLAAGLTPAQIAAALRVGSKLVLEWEDGAAVPDPDVAPAYTRLLEGLAARFPAPEEPAAGPARPAPPAQVAPAAPPAPPEAVPAVGQQTPVAPAAPAPVPGRPAAPAGPQPVMLDQHPDGSLVMAAAASCVQCGQPSVYRAQGRPMHLGGFCRPAPAAAPATSTELAAEVEKPAPAPTPVADVPAAPTGPAASAPPASAPPASGPAASGPQASAPQASAAPASGPAASGPPAAAPPSHPSPSHPSPSQPSPSHPAPSAAPAPARAHQRPTQARTPNRTVPPRAAAQPSAAAPTVGPTAAPTAGRWATVVALDAAEDGGWALDVPGFPAPAGPKLTDWFAWLGTGLPLRVERAHPQGRGGDGALCLTAAALKQLGLPAALPTTDKALNALRAKLAKAAASVGMEVSEAIGPVFRAFRRAGSAGGPKTSLQITVAPWLGQGDARQQAVSALAAPLATAPDDTRNGATFARRYRAFAADLGVAPGATTATTAMLLLDAVRPREEWVKDQETGEWSSHPREGALPKGDRCVPIAAGARHPLTRELLSEGKAVCEEEDYKWWARELTTEETGRKFAVAVDVCASYLSVTDSLPLPIGELEHTTRPDWGKGRTAGLWLCDFTGAETDELLPHPATFHGRPPTGPGWYATPTVAYMATTYGFDPATITEACLSTHTAPLLKEWTTRIRAGYKRVYADLGLIDGQGPAEFLTAYAAHKDTGGDPVRADALTLAALYKNIYKGGIGKWSDSARHLDDDTWLEKAATSWTYRPEIRFHIIAAARTAAHRRLRKTWLLTGRAPFAVNVDSYLYATDDPTPLELLPAKDDGAPVPGALRLGIAPGSHKHEASVPLDAVVEAMGRREHPSRLTRSYATDGTRTGPEQAGAESTDEQKEGEA